MRPCYLLAGLIGLSPATALARDECRLHVDAGALSGRMAALLARELPDCEVVTSSGAATLTLAIMRMDAHLDVDMVAPPATPVLARRVAIDDGDPEPALRRIALLAARAVESSALLPPSELGSVDGARARHLSAEASLAVQWWAAPSKPAFGPALSISFDLGDGFGVGIWAAWFVKSDRSLGDDVRASSTEVSALLRGSWRPLQLGPLSLGIELGGGINLVRVRAKPVRFVEGTDQTVELTPQGLARGGGVADLWLVGDRLHIFARGGGLLRVNEVRLPIHADYGGGAIRTGNIGPYVEAGLALRFF